MSDQRAPRRVAILGAGAMGSALATPLRARGHDVVLWGTRLDEPFLTDYAAGAEHPGTGERLPAGVVIEHADGLAAAIEGSHAVIVAVASAGVLDVARAMAPHLADQLVVMVSKGLHARLDGSIGLMPDAVVEGLGRTVPIVAVGGPCKANEVAAGRTTLTAYAAADVEVARAAAALLATDDYRIEVGDDLVGLEVAAPLKNVYAIALGIADGLEARTGVPWHNLRSAIFARSVVEMGVVATRLGGRESTVAGLAGAGDLEVTGLSGRNKVFGVRLGRGESAAEAGEAMRASGLTVEGVPAAALAVRLAEQLDIAHELPMLRAIEAVLAGEPAKESIVAAL